MSERAEGNECMDSFGDWYGYAGKIDEIRTQEFKRLEGNIVERSVTSADYISSYWSCSGWRHRVVFIEAYIYSYNTSLHPIIEMGTSELTDAGLLHPDTFSLASRSAIRLPGLPVPLNF